MVHIIYHQSKSEVTQSFQLFTTLSTIACQAPLFMGFSRQEYWSGLPLFSPGDLPDPGIYHQGNANSNTVRHHYKLI